VIAAVLVAATTALIAPPGAPGAERPWKPNVKGAREFAQTRAGVVSFAVRTSRREWGYRKRYRTRTASTIKTMLALAYLRRANTRRRALTAYDRSLLEPTIRRSDNDAATQVRNIVGNARISRLARRAGMREFAVSTIWGSSLVSARDLARLFWRLERLAPRRHRDYLMGLLRTIVSYQRWGVARAKPRGWKLYFKGGWGSGSGAVNHQSALLARGRKRVAFAITTTGNPSHAYGSATLEGVARRLLRGL